jgi:hypothetical protein
MKSKTNIQVLNFQIDIKLKWDSHVRKIQKKMIKQSMILIKIFASIWDINFRKRRLMYVFVVRSILIYVFVMWHMLKNKKTNVDDKLTMLQNKCLRIVANVFRITFVSILEIETHIISMRTHLNQLQTQTRLWLKIESCAKYISNFCKNIINKCEDRIDRRQKHRIILKKLKHVLTIRQLIVSIASLAEKSSFALWTNYFRTSSNREKFIKQRMRKIKKIMRNNDQTIELFTKTL